MVLHGECTICKETREGSKYRKVSEDSKIKAEAGDVWMNLYHFQHMIVKNAKCALCKETNTENFRTIKETT